MEKFTIYKKNSIGIPCISEIPKDCRRIAIVIHGMCSSKESTNAAFLLNFMPQRGIGVIAYDQPGHGSQEARSEELRIDNCMESLKAVEEYIKAQYPHAEVCYFASSFGAYILGIYLARRLNFGRKAFMRCAAVCFPQIILGNADASQNAANIAEIIEKGYVDVKIGGDDPVRFSLGFFEDLKDNDLYRLFDEKAPQDVSMQFVHGENDPLVPVTAVMEFASKHGYPISVVPDEGHSICDHKESPHFVAELAYDFFIEADKNYRT